MVCVRRFAAFVVITAGALTTARPAHADLGTTWSIGPAAVWSRQIPPVSSPALALGSRELGEASVTTRTSMVMLGGHFDSRFVINDRWLIPFFGGGLYGATGSYDTVLTAIDGSVATLRPSTLFRVEALLPGLGYRYKHRRNMLAISVRPGFSGLRMSGAVADGRGSEAVDFKGTAFLVQAEFQACRRLDPEFRICVDVAPRLYEAVVANGAMVGLSMEWGR